MTPAWFNTRRAPPAAPRDAAVYWSARRRLGLATARDAARFQAWIADPDNAAAFADIEAPLDAAGDLAGADEIRAMRELALARYPARRQPARLALLAVAAALLAAILSALVLPITLGARTPPSGVVTPEQGRDADIVPRAYASRVGERLSVRLDDGSLVTLNTASRIEVAYDDRQRLVRLLQGQALFEVAKHQPRPFVVAAGDRRITATGTAFDVRVDRGRVKVVLIEGRVLVDPLHPTGLASVLPLQRQALAPGEELIASATRTVSVATADIDRDMGWSRGQLVFRDDRLEDAVAEMNRYATDTLVIEDPRIGALRISGVFGTARPENFQAMLTSYYPLTIEARADHARVLTWRDAARDEARP